MGVVQGINLITMVWTQGDSHIPQIYQLYDKTRTAPTKGPFSFNACCSTASRLKPACIVFDGWYSSLENLKTIRAATIGLWQGSSVIAQWTRMAWVIVHCTGRSWRLVELLCISKAMDGQSIQDSYPRRWHWLLTTNDLTFDAGVEWLQLAESAWTIGISSRTRGSFVGERCQLRASCAQRNHIGLAPRAFFASGVSKPCEFVNSWNPMPN